MATATDKAKDAKLNTFRGGPDERGHFGIYGGRFVAETLMPLIFGIAGSRLQIFSQGFGAARNQFVGLVVDYLRYTQTSPRSTCPISRTRTEHPTRARSNERRRSGAWRRVFRRSA